MIKTNCIRKIIKKNRKDYELRVEIYKRLIEVATELDLKGSTLT